MFRFSRQEQYILIVLLLAIFSGSGILIYKNSVGQVITVMDSAESTQGGGREETEEAVEEPPVPDEVPKKIYVHVSGAVVKPGVYELEEGSRVYAAIESAGGVTEDAELDSLNLAQVLRDAQKVHVPLKGSDYRAGDSLTSPVGTSISEEEGFEEGRGEKGGVVNINRASVEELDALPGIGPTLAERIVEYRRVHGRFEAKEDLMKVSGIGEKKFIEIEGLVVVE